MENKMSFIDQRELEMRVIKENVLIRELSVPAFCQKNGAFWNVTAIEQGSRAKVQKNRPNKKSPDYRQISIRGTPSQVNSAKHWMEQWENSLEWEYLTIRGNDEKDRLRRLSTIISHTNGLRQRWGVVILIRKFRNEKERKKMGLGWTNLGHYEFQGQRVHDRSNAVYQDPNRQLIERLNATRIATNRDRQSGPVEVDDRRTNKRFTWIPECNVIILKQRSRQDYNGTAKHPDLVGCTQEILSLAEQGPWRGQKKCMDCRAWTPEAFGHLCQKDAMWYCNACWNRFESGSSVKAEPSVHSAQSSDMSVGSGPNSLSNPQSQSEHGSDEILITPPQTPERQQFGPLTPESDRRSLSSPSTNQSVGQFDATSFNVGHNASMTPGGPCPEAQNCNNPIVTRVYPMVHNVPQKTLPSYYQVPATYPAVPANINVANLAMPSMQVVSMTAMYQPQVVSVMQFPISPMPVHPVPSNCGFLPTGYGAFFPCATPHLVPPAATPMYAQAPITPQQPC